MWKHLLILISISNLGVCQQRKLQTRLNPDCSNCSWDTTLVYTRGDGPDDSLHQIWDFTRGEPTIIFAVTHLDNNVSFVWQDEKPVHFVLKEPPIYSFTISIHQIWEYMDKNDTGIWEPGMPTHKIHATQLLWHRRDLLYDDELVTLRLNASLPDTNNGTMQLNLRWWAFTDYATSLPHLMHSSNSSLMEVSLCNASSHEWWCPRMALLLTLASADPTDQHWTSKVTDVLDDEHTPGIFKIVEVKSPRGGDLQYRPVSYTTPEHEVTSSTLAQLGFLNRSQAVSPASTAGVWFSRTDARDVLTQSLLVSFGSAADGCYTHTNYTSWSAVLVYGELPAESWSLRLWVWLSSGITAPILLLLLICLCK